MKGFIEWKGKKYAFDPAAPLDLSIPMRSGHANPNAFGIQEPSFEPVQYGSFVGSVQAGGSVNCENLFMNAHGNGTHTECVGHISHERISINSCLRQFFFMAELVSVPATAQGDDELVMLDSVKSLLKHHTEALIIRSLPNGEDKLTKNYSGNNPAYLDPALCAWLCENGVKHLLIDLPSVDREYDEGKLSAHHAFWNYPEAPRMDATITEMAYIPDAIADGLYLLHMQIAALETDASPSKPVLYTLQQTQ